MIINSLVKQQKREMRSKINSFNKDLENKDFSKEDSLIINKVLKSDQYRTSKTILLYYPMSNEVNTISLIEQSLREKKTVCLPKIKDGSMIFVPIDKDWKNKLYTNNYNIKEPISNQILNEFNECLMIVPNLGLGRDNTRLGHGKGFYDIFLQNKKSIFKMGICRKHVLFDSLPTEKDDILLDIVISSI